MKDEIWRCDLKAPCVKYCESKNNKHQCGIYKRNNMKIELELNAKCKNCIHWHFETEDMMDFLEDGETYCELDNKKRKEQEECERLELDTFNLKSNLASAGFQRVKIK